MAIPKKASLLAILGLAFLCGAALAARELIDDDSAMAARHEQWIAQYGRVYKDAAEKARRFEVFKANVRFIESFNNAGASNGRKFWLGVNQFADLTNDEMLLGVLGRGRHGGHRETQHRQARLPLGARAGGLRRPRRGPGLRGRPDGRRLQVHHQQRRPHHRIQLPLRRRRRQVQERVKQRRDHQGYEDVPANDEAALMKAVASQPVSVAVDGGDMTFQFYKGGVMTGSCGTDLDHGIAAIGYGVASDGTKYWLMKNSWGTTWGENGFLRMEKDISDKKGMCGLAMEPSYPTE
ncbi:hypothetical protein EJB05_08500, partial [Eragrostis curvula]